MQERLELEETMLPYILEEEEHKLTIKSNPLANAQTKLLWVNKLFQKYEEDVSKINDIEQN